MHNNNIHLHEDYLSIPRNILDRSYNKEIPIFPAFSNKNYKVSLRSWEGTGEEICLITVTQRKLAELPQHIQIYVSLCILCTCKCRVRTRSRCKKDGFLPLNQDCPRKQWYTEGYSQEHRYLLSLCRLLRNQDNEQKIVKRLAYHPLATKSENRKFIQHM